MTSFGDSICSNTVTNMACKSCFSFIWLKDCNHSSEQPNLLAYICKFSEILSWKGETVVHVHSHMHFVQKEQNVIWYRVMYRQGYMIMIHCNFWNNMVTQGNLMSLNLFKISLLWLLIGTGAIHLIIYTKALFQTLVVFLKKVGIHQKLYSHQIYGASIIECNQPNSIKPKMVGRELRSCVNW